MERREEQRIADDTSIVVESLNATLDAGHDLRQQVVVQIEDALQGALQSGLSDSGEVVVPFVDLGANDSRNLLGVVDGVPVDESADNDVLELSRCNLSILEGGVDIGRARGDLNVSTASAARQSLSNPVDLDGPVGDGHINAASRGRRFTDERLEGQRIADDTSIVVESLNATLDAGHDLRQQVVVQIQDALQDALQSGLSNSGEVIEPFVDLSTDDICELLSKVDGIPVDESADNDVLELSRCNLSILEGGVDIGRARGDLNRDKACPTHSISVTQLATTTSTQLAGADDSPTNASVSSRICSTSSRALFIREINCWFNSTNWSLIEKRILSNVVSICWWTVSA
uniref:Uncharacterized protein n=1 Tax=Anopheles atroparvus TaxID=41427 RepID=A0A182J220_ANOAO